MTGVVAVTGATGFIGNHLVTTLTGMGYHVKALSRKYRDRAVDAECIKVDLADNAALAQLVSDTDTVIHCAGMVRGNGYKVFEDANVTGTANLIRAIDDQDKTPRLIFISSLAAREPHLSWYAMSKYQAEQLLVSANDHLDWSIIRPTAVYGPGDKELSPLFKATKFGLLPITGSADSRLGLIYVEDLVQAIILCIKSPDVTRKVYELDDGTPGGYDRYKIKKIAEQVWGHKVRIISAPILLAKGIAQINLFLSGILNYLPMLTPGKVRELNHHDWVCNIVHFVNDTGWQPKTLLKDGLEKAILS
ncbi:MAG: NAD(P)-dependent oxidoreductase [Gammaproteobacteria bacterium]|nr:NAD(P)-dependent oxidoreductase [Gammaproteobacteria bacterium]